MALLYLPGWEWILFGFLATVFFIVGIVLAVIILGKLRWPMRVVVVADMSGKGFSIRNRDRARTVAFGDSGEEVFLLKKLNKVRIGYGKRIGHNQIMWVISPTDGYWYNCELGNLDKKLLELGVIPVDRDLRFAVASIRKGIEARYDQKSFMDKYGAMLHFGLFFMTMLIFAGVMWFVFDQIKDLVPALLDLSRTLKEIAEVNRETLSSLDNIVGGSGIRG